MVATLQSRQRGRQGLFLLIPDDETFGFCVFCEDEGGPMCIEGLIPFAALDPGRDDVIDLIVDALDRAERKNISDKRVIADMILHDLKAVRANVAAL